MVHDDGDEEDVETHELEKAAKYYEEGIQEQPEWEREEVSLSSLSVSLLVTETDMWA